MIPKEELMDKPIKLRNNLIFYLGHIPTFAGKIICRIVECFQLIGNRHPYGESHWRQANGSSMLLVHLRTRHRSRCASQFSLCFRWLILCADVDNPELCHAHSELPDTFPPLDEMLDYQANVRERIQSLVEVATADRKVARAVWLAFEHEVMHLETFLYMLLQSERVLAPPGRPVPEFKALASKAKQERVANQWHRIPSTVITLGLDDPENDLGPDRYFGWDNERPARKEKVAEFEAQSRPISNGEYARFLEQSGFELLPASWSIKSKTGIGKRFSRVFTNGSVNGNVVNGNAQSLNGEANGHADHAHDWEVSEDFLHGKFVRTVYGPVPLEYALDWPVMASYDELAAFAKWSNGRIPTLGEAQSIYNHVEAAKEEAAEVPSSLISAVNGYL